MQLDLSSYDLSPNDGPTIYPSDLIGKLILQITVRFRRLTISGKALTNMNIIQLRQKRSFGSFEQDEAHYFKTTDLANRFSSKQDLYKYMV